MTRRYVVAWVGVAVWRACLADDTSNNLQCSAEFLRFVSPKDTPKDLSQKAFGLATNIMRTIDETMKSDFNYVNSLLNLFVTNEKKWISGDLFHRFVMPDAQGGFFKTAMKTTEFVCHVLHNNTDPAYASLFMNRSATEDDPWWAANEDYKAYHLAMRGSSHYALTNLTDVRPEEYEYYPVHYIEPVNGNEKACGYDTASNAVRRNALKTAERVAGRIVTGRVQLANQAYEKYGFVMWNPVFQDKLDPTRFTIPRRNNSIPMSRLWPAGFVTAAYIVQDLLQISLGTPSLQTLTGEPHAGASTMTLVFQKLGYPGVDPTVPRAWEFFAGFSTYQQTDNDTWMERFNQDWKNNREADLRIVAHELLCSNITVDEAGSWWHIVFAVDYGCQEGEYLVQQGIPGQRLSRCEPCPAGLYCSGMADRPNFEVPKGFFAPEWDESTASASVYECRPAAACPGGKAGACAAGRVGIPCAECLDGYGWSGTQCSPCAATGAVAWAFVLLGVFVGLGVMYYAGRSPMTEKPSISMALSSSFGIGVMLLQLVSIIRLVPIDWPDSAHSAMQGSSWIMLDGDTISLDCIVGPKPLSRYSATVLVFPAALVNLIFLKFISGFIPRRWDHHRWAWPETFSIIGLVMRMIFTTMCNVALMPFMCYKHPNGKRSVLKYSGVICGEGVHGGMAALGVLLLLLTSTFVTVLITVSWLAPRWSAMGAAGHVRLRAFRFLLVQFRGDAWWYGSFLVLRGFALSLPAALATDSPVAQLLALCFILLASLALQVYLWPWKVPLVNALDAFVSMMLTMVICWGIFYAPHVAQGSLADLDRLGLVIFAILIFAVCVALLWTVYFLLKRSTGADSAFQFALGRPPNTKELAFNLHTLAVNLASCNEDSTQAYLEELSVYDVLALAGVVTVLGGVVGESTMHMSRRVIYTNSTDSLRAVMSETPRPMPSTLSQSRQAVVTV